MDKFYTPAHIASAIINCVTNKQPDIIADFTAGNGDLLTAAELIWPKKRFIANDNDKSTVKKLRTLFPTWDISNCNFLSDKSQKASEILRSVKGVVSLILLNPPFSCRGGSKIAVNFNSKTITCSTSMAFLLRSLGYLHCNGEVLAILPQGTINNEKDQVAWAEIKLKYSVKLMDSFSRYTFYGCFPNTILVKISETPTPSGNINLHKTIYSSGALNTYKIVRGTQQIHRLCDTVDYPTPNTLPFLHTTRMAIKALPICWIKVHEGTRTVKSPAVLIPRVGEPRRDKICIYLDSPTAVVSDCILAVECPDVDSAFFLADFIVSTWWDKFCKLYGGTCAKFLTISKLHNVLELAENRLNSSSKSLVSPLSQA